LVRGLQTHIIDLNRQDSLQLLRIQNNLHSLALAMRDMVEGSEPYPLESWKMQFDRIRIDLEDALGVEARINTGVEKAGSAEAVRRRSVAVLELHRPDVRAGPRGERGGSAGP